MRKQVVILSDGTQRFLDELTVEEISKLTQNMEIVEYKWVETQNKKEETKA